MAKNPSHNVQIPSGGLAAWSMRHPVGVVMLALAVIVSGSFSLKQLGVDLLPHIIYPEVRVRILDPGVPATIMEDRITRQLEEQLAITENAIAIQSNTREGRSSVDLSFPYGTDIDIALRDASTRLDRAKRFLPSTVDPPIIYKRDPSQIAIAEFAVSSTRWDPVELRSWVDYVLAKWFVNLPGVAATEVGGGLLREIQVLPDQQRLAGLGLDIFDLLEALEQGNVETPGGTLLMAEHQISGRTAGRFRDLSEIENLPIPLELDVDGMQVLPLHEIAGVLDGHEDEELRIRLNDVPGVKLSIQKQPQANTVAVADTVRERLRWLRSQDLLPADIRVAQVSDQATFVRRALDNAAMAALSGGVLAMLVVYLFLGNLRRTLIIGSAIPIAIMVTFTLMALGGLTLNTMTLGGLALGIGMLVDNTIVMLENIVRHQRTEEAGQAGPLRAAAEVTSAIVASTTTNLAAVLPFLFIGGLIGLLFRELIFTISAAIVASLVVALTLVPALAARVPHAPSSDVRKLIDRLTSGLQNGYASALSHLLRVRWAVLMVFLTGMWWYAPALFTGKQIFLPSVDNGEVRVRVVADPDVNLDDMDRAVAAVEATISQQPEVQTWFTTVGGYVFGRSQYLSPNRSSIEVKLVPAEEREITTFDWIARMRGQFEQQQSPGVKIRIGNRGIRGIRLGSGDESVSLRIQGPDLEKLGQIGDEVVERLGTIPGLNNVKHSAEDVLQEITVEIDRHRASTLGLTVEEVGKAVRAALDGITATDFIDDDRSIDVKLRLPHSDMSTPEDLGSVLLFNEAGELAARLGEIATIRLAPTPAGILRDQQRRIVEVSGSLSDAADMAEITAAIDLALADLHLPEAYSLYDSGAFEDLQESRRLSQVLLGLALFLVVVVLAVQYESLRNPIIILISVPFALIGVSMGIELADLPVSMPVWLGLIMLAGIVVNNTIVLVEYIELQREHGHDIRRATVEAARLRLRPILMTTLTTVVGMLPLALGFGAGTEMLEPLAITIVAGLSFSTLVSLLLVPSVYCMLAKKDSVSVRQPEANSAGDHAERYVERYCPPRKNEGRTATVSHIPSPVAGDG